MKHIINIVLWNHSIRRAASGLLLAVIMSSTAFSTVHVIQFGGTFGNAYVPPSLTVTVGDTIEWQGPFSVHPLSSTSVPAGASAWHNGTGTVFDYVVGIPGAYNYQCDVHGGLGMVGAFTALSAKHIIQFGGIFGENYVPNKLTVAVGDTIEWQGPFSQHPLSSTTIPPAALSWHNATGTIFDYTADFLGTYHYQCDFHFPFGMIGLFTAVDSVPGVITLLSPANNATLLPVTPTLRWNSVFGASSYHLQISTVSNFASIAFEDPSLSDTTRAVPPLNHGTQYYWRVRGENFMGPGDWSSVWNFTTIPAVPLAPLLISPDSAAFGASLSPLLAWHSVAAADSYRVQLSSDPGFSSLHTDSATTDTAVQTGGLSLNTLYYWRARAKNIAGTGPWSNVWRFKTIPPLPTAPLLASPDSGAVNRPTTLSLKWNSVVAADSFRVEVANDTSFVLPFRDKTVADTQVSITGLAFDTLYYWRVRAQNILGISPWSSTWNFSTLSSGVNLTVSASDGWNMLSVPLIVPDFSKTVLYPTATSSAFAFTTHYVTADTLGTGLAYWLKFSGTQDVILSGSAVQHDTISMNAGWNMIGSVSASVPTSAVATIGTTIRSLFYGYAHGYSPIDTIRPGMGYWVKVDSAGKLVLSIPASASGRIEHKARSEAFDQLIIEDAAGNRQVLYYTGMPAPDFELPPVPPSGVFDARFTSGNMVESIGRDGRDDHPIRISSARYPVRITWKNQTGTTAAVLVSGGKEISLKGDGSALLSAPSPELRLASARPAGIPAAFGLGQNYPNPFNPTTTIGYDLPRDARVSLKVYDIMGQEVATLVDGNQTAGHRSVEFRPDRFASGTYIYRITIVSGGTTFRDVKKMTVVK